MPANWVGARQRAKESRALIVWHVAERFASAKGKRTLNETQRAQLAAFNLIGSRFYSRLKLICIVAFAGFHYIEISQPYHISKCPVISARSLNWANWLIALTLCIPFSICCCCYRSRGNFCWFSFCSHYRYRYRAIRLRSGPSTHKPERMSLRSRSASKHSSS